MKKIVDLRYKIEQAKRKIEFAESKKKELELAVQKLVGRHIKGEINRLEYYDELNKALDGRTPRQWIKYYDNYIEKVKLEIDSHRNGIRQQRIGFLKNKYLISGFLVLVFVAIAVFFFYSFGPGVYYKLTDFSRGVDSDFGFGKERKEIDYNAGNLVLRAPGPLADEFVVLDEGSQFSAEVGKPVKWRKNIVIKDFVSFDLELHEDSEKIVVREIEGGVKKEVTEDVEIDKKGVFDRRIEVSVDGLAKEYEIEYETPAPQIEEEEIFNGKRVIISGPDELGYKNVLSHSNLPRGIEDSGKVKLYRDVDGEEVEHPFSVYDLDEDGLYDYIEWITPKLSEETFIIIIEISKAEHLDADYNFVEDIYEHVREKDGDYSPVIGNNEYVRVSFEEPLDKGKDITIYARKAEQFSEDSKIEVYRAGDDRKIAEFENIGEEGEHKIFLTSLDDGEFVESFDLKVIGRVEFDYIVDPLLLGLISHWDFEEVIIGNDIVDNGNFDNANNWNLGSSWNYDFFEQAMKATAPASYDSLTQTTGPFSRQLYWTSFEIKNYVKGQAKICLGSSCAPFRSGNGVFKESFWHPSGNDVKILAFSISDSGDLFHIDNVKVGKGIIGDNTGNNEGTLEGRDINFMEGGLTVNNVDNGQALKLSSTPTPNFNFDYMATGLPDNLGNQFTFSAWIKPSSDPDDNQNERPTIMGWDPQGFRKSLYMYQPWGAWRFEVPLNGRCAANGGGTTPGVWKHVVGIADGEAGTVKIYVNGRHKDTENCGTGSIETFQNNLRIGSVGGVTLFDGLIDEVKVFNRVISEPLDSALCWSGEGATVDDLNSELCLLFKGVEPRTEECKVLDVAGERFVMISDVDANVVGDNGKCFEITANDVELECNGFGISSTVRDQTGIYVAPGVNGVKISNCEVSMSVGVPGGIGIELNEAVGATILNSKFDRNDIVGVKINGGGGHEFDYVRTNHNGVGIEVLNSNVAGQANIFNHVRSLINFGDGIKIDSSNAQILSSYFCSNSLDVNCIEGSDVNGADNKLNSFNLCGVWPGPGDFEACPILITQCMDADRHINENNDAGATDELNIQDQEYLVANDIFLDSGQCLWPQASGITIDMNGYTMSNPNQNPFGRGLQVSNQVNDGITIKNGQIENFLYGIEFSGSLNDKLINMMVDNIILKGNIDGLRYTDVENSIANNLVIDSNIDRSVFLSRSKNNILSNSLIVNPLPDNIDFYVYSTGVPISNTLVNFSYDDGNDFFDYEGVDLELIRKWHYGAHVIDDSGRDVSGADVLISSDLSPGITDSDFNLLTNSEGNVKSELIEYRKVHSGFGAGQLVKTYYNPFNIDSSKFGFSSDNHFVDVSGNVLEEIVLTDLNVNSPPEICDIEPPAPTSVYLNSDDGTGTTTTSVGFNLVVYDSDGVGDLPTSGITANGYYERNPNTPYGYTDLGHTRRSFAGVDCSPVLAPNDIVDAGVCGFAGQSAKRYVCNVDMFYYDDPLDWKIYITGFEDINGESAINLPYHLAEDVFAPNPIKAISLTSPSINFGEISSSFSQGVPSLDPQMIIKNFGNVHYDSSTPDYTLHFRGRDLTKSGGTEIISSENFIAHLTEFPNCADDSENIVMLDKNDVLEGVPFNALNLRNGDLLSDTDVGDSDFDGGHTIRFCMISLIDSDLPPGDYSTGALGTNDPWRIDPGPMNFVLSLIKLIGFNFGISALLASVRIKRKGLRSKKIQNVTGDKLLDVLEEKLKKEYDVGILDIVDAVKRVRKKGTETINIPLSIFKEGVGPAEILCKYLKENLGLKFSEIAGLINRDERTIGINYKNALKKKKGKIKVGGDKISVNIFSNRKLSVLESVVRYLKNKGLKNYEISEILGKDQRNIWTIYSRSLSKLK